MERPVILSHRVQFAPVWLVFIAGSVLSTFGWMLQLEQGWLNLSPCEYVGQHPATDVAWAGVALLAAAGVLLSLLGAPAFRRRNLTAT